MRSKAGVCGVCGRGKVVKLLDLGRQPVSARFQKTPSAKAPSCRFAAGQCAACGLVQLIYPVDPSALTPSHGCAKHNEPEAHLDKLADTICGLPGLNRGSRILGLSYKDDTLLERLKKKGFSGISRVDPAGDLGIRNKNAGVEIIQSRLSSGEIARFVRRQGRFNVVLARHIFEHTSDQAGFMANIGKLLSPGGYVVMEVPDCEKAFKKCDYNILWEEHSLYFTPATFLRFLRLSGFSVLKFKSYPYSLENSLVAVAAKAAGPLPPLKPLKKEKDLAAAYFRGFPPYREKVRRAVAGYLEKTGKLAVWGAGHFAASFINMMGLKGYVGSVIDDNPGKQGLYMPGSGIPVRSSVEALKKGAGVYLLSMNPANEGEFMKNNRQLAGGGAVLKSIFPVSGRFLFKKAGL